MHFSHLWFQLHPLAGSWSHHVVPNVRLLGAVFGRPLGESLGKHSWCFLGLLACAISCNHLTAEKSTASKTCHGAPHPSQIPSGHRLAVGNTLLAACFVIFMFKRQEVHYHTQFAPSLVVSAPSAHSMSRMLQFQVVLSTCWPQRSHS